MKIVIVGAEMQSLIYNSIALTSAVIFVKRTVYEDASIEVVVLWQIALSVRRMGDIAVGVAPANKAVAPEDVNVAPLISGDPAGSLERFLPGVEVALNPYGARPGSRLNDCATSQDRPRFCDYVEALDWTVPRRLAIAAWV